MGKVFPEALQFGAPLVLNHQWFGTNHQDGIKLLTRLKLLDDEASFDGLTDADIVSDEEPWAVGIDELHDRSILVRLIVYASTIE